MSEIKWKPGKGQSWRAKLEQVHPNHGKMVPTPPRMQKSFGKGMMLIPQPLDVEAAMRTPKKGEVITQSQLREMLARNAGADSSCPLTTGIFMRIVAEAAEEDRRAGKSRITPYWRTIRDDGSLNEKFPGGVRAQTAKLREEGLSLERGKGNKPPRVRGFEAYLVNL